MTADQICCICLGITIQAATFALGLVVGASLRRKDSTHVATGEGTACTHAAGRSHVASKPDQFPLGGGAN